MDDTSDSDVKPQSGHSKWPTHDSASTLDTTVEQNVSAIGHRLQAHGSVLALVIDHDYIFAGLQGGDIVVCFHLSVYQSPTTKKQIRSMFRLVC